jgi:hypothetical protein
MLLARHGTTPAASASCWLTPPPGTEEVIGCLYIYPAKNGGSDAVRSWDGADVAELDGRLHSAGVATGSSSVGHSSVRSTPTGP